MAAVNFYLKDKKSTVKTGIMLFFSYNGTRNKICTVESIEPKFWDNNKQRAKQTKAFKVYPEFNTRLQKIEEKAIDVYRTYLNNNEQQQTSETLIKDLIKEAINNTPRKRANLNYDLLSYTKQFILDSQTGKRLNDKGKPLAYNTTKVYGIFKSNLVLYKKDTGRSLSFEYVEDDFYPNFMDWMLSVKKYSTNTIYKQVRTLKLIVNSAADNGITTNRLLGNRFKAITEETEAPYLSEQELKLIYDLDLSNKSYLDRARDLFLVGCWTGLRYSDFSTIKKSYISEKFITIPTRKTGKEVVIPILPVVKAILEKYKGKTENSLPPPISNQKTNEFLKIIAEEAQINEMIIKSITKGGKVVTIKQPKFNFVTCHTARRSFATNMYLRKVSPITIMAITGHVTETSFMKYIKVTPTEHAERLSSMWEEQFKSMAV